MSSEWPLGEGVRTPARPLRTRRRALPRVTWVLAAAAFLCGALVSAAALSVGWHHASTETSSVRGALDEAKARNQTLAASLAAARSYAAKSRRTEKAATAAAAKVSREAARLTTALAAARTSSGPVSSGAAALGSDLDRLAGELRTLDSYLGSTPTSQLDPGYVATQASYLAKQLDRLRAERSDLAAAIAQFDSGVKRLSDRAAALAGRQ
jgi:uncharacterized phage infection (PIP) family protein YhgE